jgi:cystathionine beta-lyase
MFQRRDIQVPVLPQNILDKKRSVKWHDVPAGVIPLPVAEMDFEIDQGVRSTLIEMISESDTGYLGKMPELFENFATFANTRWGWKPNVEMMYTATDVGVGMVEMARQVVNPGDRILISSPVYHNFFNWLKELKCETIDAPLKRNGMEYSLDLPAIEKVFASGIKLYFLCNPQNPTGSVHSKADLMQIAELAKKYGVKVFSDEIHAPLTYEEKDFHPFLSLSDAAREVGITVTSASKTWNLAGLKLAIIVVQSETMNEVAKSMPYAVHYRASLIGAIAQIEAWKAVDWLDSTLTRLDDNRKFLKELLDQELPRVKYRIPDTSYLAWLDFSDYQVASEISQYLLENAKVMLIAGNIFGPGADQFARLNFGTSKEILTEAIMRIKSALPA